MGFLPGRQAPSAEWQKDMLGFGIKLSFWKH
jgi:hypothetical protein